MKTEEKLKQEIERDIDAEVKQEEEMTGKMKTEEPLKEEINNILIKVAIKTGMEYKQNLDNIEKTIIAEIIKESKEVVRKEVLEEVMKILDEDESLYSDTLRVKIKRKLEELRRCKE